MACVENLLCSALHVLKCSFLLDEWFEADLTSILERVIQLLANEGKSLRGANEIVQDLQTFLCDPSVRRESADVGRKATDAMREYALLLLGKLGTTANEPSVEQQRVIAQQLVYAFQLAPRTMQKSSTARAAPSDELADGDEEAIVIMEVAHELEASSTHEALHTLRQDDTLESHLRHSSPANGEICHRVPQQIAIRFDTQVVDVDTPQVLKVLNTTLTCGVQGKVAFAGGEGVLTFTPAVPFEKKTKYTLKLRGEAIQTCLATLHGTVALHFATT